MRSAVTPAIPSTGVVSSSCSAAAPKTTSTVASGHRRRYASGKRHRERRRDEHRFVALDRPGGHETTRPPDLDQRQQREPERKDEVAESDERGIRRPLTQPT